MTNESTEVTDDVTVSPEEMNALMETIQEGAKARREVGPDGAETVRYDLVAARAVGGQLPTLDLVNERFATLLTATLRRITGELATVSVSTAAPLKFLECLGSLPVRTCVQVVELIGLRGTGIIVFDPSLLFLLIDHLLGGTPSEFVDADATVARRGLTAVEERLFAHLIKKLGADLTQSWDGVASLAIRPVRVETDPKHVAIFEHGELVVDAVFEVDIAEVQGQIHLILPHSALRPIEKKLASGLLASVDDGGSDWATPLRKLLSQVSCVCTAELGRTTIAVRDLLELKTGDVIRLDRDPENPITVYVEGVPKLLGTPTLEHGNIAIEVQTKISTSTDKHESGVTQ